MKFKICNSKILIFVSLFIVLVSYQNCGKSFQTESTNIFEKKIEQPSQILDVLPENNTTDSPSLAVPVNETSTLSMTSRSYVPTTIVLGKKYYMSPLGKDTNSGTSVNFPWKTLVRLQAAQSILKPGDAVFFSWWNL